MSNFVNSLASVIGSIGSHDFGRHFFTLAQETLDADQCLAFRLNESLEPKCLLVETQHRKTKKLYNDIIPEYTETAYKSDPNILELSQSGLEGNQFIIRETRYEQIKDNYLKRRFFDAPKVKHELSLITAIDGSLFYFVFMRGKDQHDFAMEDAKLLSQMSELLAQTLRKHSEMISLRSSNESIYAKPATINQEKREIMYHNLRQALLNAPGGLTNREAEVCASIALGYTSLGISLKLGISVNTVGTHRKRAYAKLGICSQSELFARYIDSVTTSGPLH